MRLRFIISLLTAVAVVATASAQTGSSAYNFLELPSSAQAFGLGGVAPAIINDDVNLVDQNPALIGPELDKQIALSYMHYLGSSNFASARFGSYAGEHGGWMVGFRYLNHGEITATDPDGTVTGSFKPSDLVFEAGYAHDFSDRVRGGIMLKGISSNYTDYSAFALATDLGINYYNPDKDLSLGFVVKNLGGQLKRFDKAYTRLPIDVQIGYMQGLGSSPFSLAITAWHLTKWNLPYYAHDKDNPSVLEKKSKFMSNLFRHLVFGLQYRPSDNFFIDLGYNYKTRTDMSTFHRSFLSGFSAALGVNVKSFRFAVSYAMPHKGGTSLMLNISSSLGELMH